MIYSRIFTEQEMQVIRDALIEYWHSTIKQARPGPYRVRVEALKDQFRDDVSGHNRT